MNKKLKFCFCTTFYPPYNFGGDGIFVHQLSNELAARGHSVEVIHCIDPDNLPSIRVLEALGADRASLLLFDPQPACLKTFCMAPTVMPLPAGFDVDPSLYPDDTDRRAKEEDILIGPIARDDLAFEPPRPFGHIVDIVSGEIHFDARERERLALFFCDHARERPGMLANLARDLSQMPRSLNRRQAPPRFLRSTRRLDGFARDAECRVPDLGRVVLHPAGLRVVLPELRVRAAAHDAALIQHETRRARGALVDGQDRAHAEDPARWSVERESAYGCRCTPASVTIEVRASVIAVPLSESMRIMWAKNTMFGRISTGLPW